MPEVIAKSTCLIHSSRSATARCPECRRFFCEECVTEHDGRLTCAHCLRDEENKGAEPVRRQLGIFVSPVLQFGIGLLMVWMLFYYTARFLMLIPASFHDGIMWEETGN